MSLANEPPCRAGTDIPRRETMPLISSVNEMPESRIQAAIEALNALDHKTPNCPSLARMIKIFVLPLTEIAPEERDHLDAPCIRCNMLRKELIDKPWIVETWLCRMYEELYPMVEKAYLKAIKS